MTTVDLTNLTPDDLLALAARIKDLQAQRQAAAAQPVSTPVTGTMQVTTNPPVDGGPSPFHSTTAAPPTVDATVTTTSTSTYGTAEAPAATEEKAPDEPTPESLLDALGVSHTSNQLANAKAWIESHLGITLP